MIAALSVALSLTVLPAAATDTVPLLLERNVPFIYATELYNNNTYDWNLIYTDSSYDLFLGVVNNQVVAGSKNDISYTYIFNGTSTTTSLDRGTSIDGTTFWFSYVRFTGTINSSIPVFSSVSEFANACYYYVPATPLEAVLVSPSDSYEYQTGFTLTNSSSSPVAAGWVDDSFYLASLDANISCQNPTVSFYLRLFDSTTSLYYSIGTLHGTTDDRIGPVFESSSDFFTSALSVLTGTGGAVADYSDYPTQFSLLPGYVGYIHLADPSDEIVLKADFDLYSNSLFGDSYWRKTMTYRDNTTLPINPRTYPVDGSTAIAWQKDPSGRTDLFGRTKSGIAYLHPTSNLIEIYNPYYSYAGGTPLPGADVSTLEFNPTIYGSTGPILSFVSYPVDSSFTASVGAITIDSTGNIDKPIIGDIVPGNPVIDTYRDKDDDPVVPVVGGDNSPPSGSDITDILNDFFNRITGLFTAGHDAIRNLVEGSSEFVSQLSGLYSWLPAPVLSVLTSAVILAIIIGVLKVFL